MNLTEKLQMERLRSGALRVIFIISNLALFITKIVDIIKNLLFLALGIRELKQRTIIVAPIERLIDKCMGMM